NTRPGTSTGALNVRMVFLSDSSPWPCGANRPSELAANTTTPTIDDLIDTSRNRLSTNGAKELASPERGILVLRPMIMKSDRPSDPSSLRTIAVLIGVIAVLYLAR